MAGALNRAFLTALLPALLVAAPSSLAGADATDSMVEELAEQLALQEDAEAEPEEEGKKGKKQKKAKKEKKDKRIEWVAVPIPFSNPTIESGLAPVVLAFYKLDPKDEKSPASYTGLGGFYSSNDSWGALLGQRLHINEDRWRVTAALGKVDLKYDFFGIGNTEGGQGRSIPLRQIGQGFFVECLRRVPGDVFLGLRYANAITEVSLNADLELPDPPFPVLLAPGIETRIAFLGFRVDRDTRDIPFYPTRGSQMTFSSDFYDEAWGSDWQYQSYGLAYNMYRALPKRQVIAYRAMGCYAGGEPPFWGLCSFGSKSDLRGYPSGRYRDYSMFATQAEYRVGLPKRFGAVAFAGLGGVASTFSDFRGEDLLPSVGVGIRWMVAKKNKINLRVDYAWGEGEQALYISVGEAF
jgi:hypothetical protein